MRDTKDCSRSELGRRRSTYVDKSNPTEDDDQRRTRVSLQEGEWTQVKGRRKAPSRTVPVLGKGIHETNALYQVTVRGKNPSSTWRDRPDITSFYFSHFLDEVRERDLWKIFQDWERCGRSSYRRRGTNKVIVMALCVSKG